ncbi:MAG TPA: putative LPS assembly protein LptD, partial [Verrucomicrobiae bacterium]|nr:putative LPS assembly protein LptD [Verrucomicrobiae bacterium]
MKRLLLLPCLLWLAACCLGRIHAQEADTATWEIDHRGADSEIEYDERTHVTTATRGVIVRFRDEAKHRQAVLTAEKMTLDRVEGDVSAEGEVMLQSDGQVWRGEKLKYNFKTGRLDGENFRTGRAPFFAAGTGLVTDKTNQTYTLSNAYVTGDDVSAPSQPNYRVRARTITLTAGKSLEARDATLYIGRVPVMYLPYYHRTFDRHPNNFEFTPGYRSYYGPYLLSTYNWYWNTNLSGAVHLDYRVKRGFGGGPDFTYDAGRWGEGSLQGYYAHDDDPGIDPLGREIPEDRHRITFTHRMTIATNFTAKVVVREQSDAEIIRDFFEHEYRMDTQPSSFLEATKTWSNFSLDAIAQPRLNDFFETVERLPDVKLTGVRQQLGASPFYYDSESSLAYLRHTYANDITNDFAGGRADTYHQITLPRTFFGWLNFTPRVGGRLTYYTETDGYNSTLKEQTRGVFNTGAELSMKASRVWGGVRNQFLDVTELRHIIEPSINYVYVPTPNVRPWQLPQYDSEIPTLRLLPIEYPDYNAIDSIDTQNVIRFGLRNKIQTKRKGQVENLVNW